jgi:two-component system OmpR family sensor kinase
MRSWPRRHALELGWVAFAIANLAAMLVTTGGWETVPFHFIWVSLTLLYGLRVWRLSVTAAILGAVCVGTTLGLAFLLSHGEVEPAEVTEVPLMSAMFLAMVWHARRRQAAQEEVRRAAEREREFVRDASHELRTPITLARGHAELIRDGSLDPQARMDAGVVLQELARLQRMAEGLLLLASAEHRNFLQPGIIDVESLIVTTAQRWGPAADRAWVVNAAAEGFLPGDLERLACALDALIENAVKFTDEGARIEIAARAEGSFAVLEISDSGTGIAPEQLGRVFERFARGECRADRRTRGTGLGLAIVRAIAEAHGGSASATSALGKGSTFRLRLPGFVPLEHPRSGHAALALGDST